jgi:homospermidine synthase
MKTLQVVSPVLSGIVEANAMDFRRNLEICMPCPGPVVGEYSDWTPLQGCGELFPEDLDKSGPWQFKNLRMS